MSKFIPPASVVKLPKATVTTDMWPLGTLYMHTPTGTMFRFLLLGGRWDAHYGISTSKGILCGKRVNGVPQYKFLPNGPEAASLTVSASTKQAVVEMLLTVL